MTAPEGPELRPARPLRGASPVPGTPDAPSGAEFEELRDLLLAAIDHLIALEDEVQVLTAAVARTARPLRATTRAEKPPG